MARCDRLLRNTSEAEINTSDIDFVELTHNGETVTAVVYLWGTQRWLGFGAAGVVRGGAEAWLASYF